jgi:hypothetical protein
MKSQQTTEVEVGHFLYFYCNASVNSSCDHPPPPPGQCGAFVCLLAPTAGHLQLRFHLGAGHLSISGLLPRVFVAHREKTAATSFLCCMPKWTTIKYVKQILYYIIVECWFSSVNECLRFFFSPYYIYCIYNEKLSALKSTAFHRCFHMK